MKRKMQKILVPDYDDPWVNRLAVVVLTIEKMENETEREAAFNFILSKFSPARMK